MISISFTVNIKLIKMIRVLHVVGKMDRAGAETMLMNLYRHIDRSKIQFDFITFTKEHADYDTEIFKLGGNIIPIVASNSFFRMIKLYYFLKKNPQYKIIHAHLLLNNSFHLLAAKFAGVKHRISHSHNTNNGNNNFIKKLYEKLSKIINKNIATYKFACGKEAAEYLFDDITDVHILPNSVELEKMLETSEKNKDFIQKKFSDNGLKIIQVGRFLPVKNHQFSLKIAQELKKRNVDFQLYFIGQGILIDEIKKQAENNFLSDRVNFLGLRTDIAELMASADYMIMPSLHEGFPVVLVESQIVGLPSLISDKISQEVDLEIDLINFLPINSAEVWVDKILEKKQKKFSDTERLNILKEKGFDAFTNAKNLTNLYQSFDNI